LAAILPSLNEAERRNVLKVVGSISKLTALTAEIAEKTFNSKIAAKLTRDLKRFRRSGAVEVIPLIMPIRFDAENGSADDLRPIRTR
jgi:hypothetical protein